MSMEFYTTPGIPYEKFIEEVSKDSDYIVVDGERRMYVMPSKLIKLKDAPKFIHCFKHDDGHVRFERFAGIGVRQLFLKLSDKFHVSFWSDMGIEVDEDFL